MTIKQLIDRYRDYKFTEGEDVIASNSLHKGDSWARSTYIHNRERDDWGYDHHIIKGGYTYFYYCLPLNEEVKNFCQKKNKHYVPNIMFLPIEKWEQLQSLYGDLALCWDRFDWDK